MLLILPIMLLRISFKVTYYSKKIIPNFYVPVIPKLFPYTITISYLVSTQHNIYYLIVQQ